MSAWALKVRPSQKGRYLRNCVLNWWVFLVLYFLFLLLKKNMTIDWSYFLKNILQVLNNREWNLTFPLTALCLLIKILQFLLSKILDIVLFHEYLKTSGSPLYFILYAQSLRFQFAKEKHVASCKSTYQPLQSVILCNTIRFGKQNSLWQSISFNSLDSRWTNWKQNDCRNQEIAWNECRL